MLICGFTAQKAAFSFMLNRAMFALSIGFLSLSLADVANANVCGAKSKAAIAGNKAALMDKHSKLFGDAAKTLTQMEGQFDKLCTYGQTTGTAIWNRVIKEIQEVVNACPDPIMIATLSAQKKKFEENKESVASDCQHSAALKSDPKDAPGFRSRGAAFAAKKEYDRAISDLTDAIRLDPNSASAYYERGGVYGAKDENERAITDYVLAIQLDPKFGGNRYFSDGDSERSIARLAADSAEALLDDPKSSAAYTRRSAAYFFRSDYDSCISDAEEAIRLDPKSAPAYNNRGAGHLHKGNIDIALRDLNEAVRLDPKASAFYRNRGNAFLQKGDIDRAIADLNEAIKLDPDQQPAYAYRGLAYEKIGRRENAIADFKKALLLYENKFYAVGLRAHQTAGVRLAELLSAPAAASAEKSSVAAEVVVSAAPPIKASPSLGGGRKIALVIGNSSYENVLKLVNPERDANLVAATFKDLGFEAVSLLTNLKKDAVVSALRNFAIQAETADWAVIYYAGHGMEVGGINYLLPIDARVASDRDISFEAVPLEQVLNAAERAKRLRLVILDACRDNPFANQMRRTLSVASRSVSRGLAAVEPEAGTLVVYAAKDGETALDGDDGKNSPFAAAFVKNVQTPGLEIRRLFDFVRDDVMEITNRKQKPFSYGSISGRQDFYFVNPR
jgi:tetratricopeptide (TPR) repeat protein